jgi:hypothetical protein
MTLPENVTSSDPALETKPAQQPLRDSDSASAMIEHSANAIHPSRANGSLSSTDPSITNAQFQLFRQLPVELRLRIWDFARPPFHEAFDP